MPDRATFVPCDSARRICDEHDLTLRDELEAWLDWCESVGREYKNDQAGFRTWLRRAAKAYGARYQRPSESPPVPAYVPASCALGLGCLDGWIDADTGPGGRREVSRCKCRKLTVESQAQHVGAAPGVRNPAFDAGEQNATEKKESASEETPSMEQLTLVL